MRRRRERPGRGGRAGRLRAPAGPQGGGAAALPGRRLIPVAVLRTDATGAVIPDRVVRHRLDRETALRYLFIGLFGLFLYLFVLYPMAKVLWRSLVNNDGAFIGVAHYVRYFSTPAIAASITNSLYVSLAAMVVTVCLAFVYAYALTRPLLPRRGAGPRR